MPCASPYFETMSLEIIPIKFDEACHFIKQHHRHHKMPRGHKYSIGCAKDGEVVGVCTVGRPVARVLDDGWTLELTRCCTDGTKNACSMLYAAAWRVAKGLGYKRLITYILDTEKGTSIKAAGWKEIGKRGGGSWNTPSRPRIDKHPTQMKIKYEITLTLLLVAQLTLAQSVMEVAEGYMGQNVSRGHCRHFVVQVIKDAGMTLNKEDTVAVPLPGDVFVTAGIFIVTSTIMADYHWPQMPPHTAIVTKALEDDQYEVIHQNMGEGVTRDTLDLSLRPDRITLGIYFVRPTKGEFTREAKKIISKSKTYL